MTDTNTGPCAGDSEDALRFLQQQHLRDSTLVSSVYLDDPDFQTYRSRYSSAPVLPLFWPFYCAVITTCSMCLLTLRYDCIRHWQQSLLSMAVKAFIWIATWPVVPWTQFALPGASSSSPSSHLLLRLLLLLSASSSASSHIDLLGISTYQQTCYMPGSVTNTPAQN